MKLTSKRCSDISDWNNPVIICISLTFDFFKFDIVTFYQPQSKVLHLGRGDQGLRNGVDIASPKKIEIASTSIKVATLGAFDASHHDPG